MKRLLCLIAAGLVYSSAASAQLPSLPAFPDLGFEGVVGELLGTDGVVPALVVTLTTQNFSPFIDATAGSSEESLAQGSAGSGLNLVLTGLLVNQDPAQVAGGLQFIVVELVNGLQTALLGKVAFPVPALPALPLPGLSGDGGSGLPGLDSLPLSADVLTGLLGSLTGGGVPGVGGLPGLDSLPLSPAILTDLLATLLGSLPGLDGLPVALPTL
ncbi:MAG: hypothetical protein L0H83_13635 [Salinisphaera sp.]|nr:hypothetical protein [Salinisphaera sp.]